MEEKLEEETNNNNTCGRRHSQHHNAHLRQECKIFNLFENSMYFFRISQTLKCLDLHCLRQKTVTQSNNGLAKIAEGASPRRHAETSPVKVKDTHLMNNKLPLTEILCGEWRLLWSVEYILNLSTSNFGLSSNLMEIALVGRAPGHNNDVGNEHAFYKIILDYSSAL